MDKTRILVIRFSSIGDIVLTTPVLRALKNQLHGGAEVHVLTKDKFVNLFEGNPHVERVYSIHTTVQEVIPELLEVGFDYIIDLHNNIRSRVVRRRLKTLTFTFRKLNLQKWLWVNLGINRMPDLHVVDRYMETLKSFSIQDDGLGLEFYIPTYAEVDIATFPSEFHSGYVAIAMGGAHAGKRMRVDQLTGICAGIPHPVVLIGGPEDRDTGEAVVHAIGSRVLNRAGNYTIHQSADVIRQARVVISGDTGMMHIAAAFQRKIVSVWGCTVPGLGMAPYRAHPDSVIIEPAGRMQRPCSKLGNRCKYGSRKVCITAISIRDITEAIERLW